MYNGDWVVGDADPYKCENTRCHILSETRNQPAMRVFPLAAVLYYDHIIRGEEDHRAAAEYIDANPARWREDEFYTET